MKDEQTEWNIWVLSKGDIEGVIEEEFPKIKSITNEGFQWIARSFEKGFQCLVQDDWQRVIKDAITYLINERPKELEMVKNA